MNYLFVPWIIFALALVVFAVLSVVLIYHWQRYGKGAAFIASFETVYLVVGISLLSLAFGILLKL